MNIYRKIAAAHVKTKDMKLNATAERLQFIRDEFERFSRSYQLRENSQCLKEDMGQSGTYLLDSMTTTIEMANNARAARIVRHLEETKKVLETESTDPAKEEQRKYYEWDWDQVAGITKAVLYTGTIVSIIRCCNLLNNDEAEWQIVAPIFGAIVSGLFVMSWAIDKIIKTGPFELNVKKVESAIVEARDAFAAYLAEVKVQQMETNRRD